MEVFTPYRPQSNYGSPGYGIYPTRPGSYMNGLGDVVMEPGRNYGPWGYQAGGGQWTPRGNRGYGIYGIGDVEGAVEWSAATLGKVAAGAAVGLAIGFFIWGR